MRTILFTALLINAIHLNAQSFEEWVKQKETQIKYLVEQIGALKAYGEVVNKGYDIARGGLTNVFSNKEEDYRQHNTYFLSFWKVNSNVLSYSKVASVFKMKADIERQLGRIRSSVTPFFSDKERTYVYSVCAKLNSDYSDLANELEMVVSDNQLQLKDDERIQRIDKIYFQMQGCYQFSQSFANEIQLLVNNRLKEKGEINKLSSVYGIK